MTYSTSTASNTNLDQTEYSPNEFVAMLQNDPARKHLQYQIPEIFFQQAKAGISTFIITPEMIADRLLNIQVAEPQKEGESAVNIKLRFTARVDEKYNFIPLAKQGEADENEETPSSWLKGFNSTLISLDQSSVIAGLITEKELKSLISHAEFYDTIPLDEYGLKSAYYKDPKYKKTKMNLSGVEGAEGQFQFLMEVRFNPEKQEETIGIVVKFWTPGAFKFLGGGNTRVVSLGAVPQAKGWTYNPNKK
jgi:hypothetical protein